MKSQSLPLSVTLRDLALLRASDVDFSSILDAENVDGTHQESLQRSQEFIKEARSALRLANNESIEQQGARIEEIRALGEQTLAALENPEKTNE
ncbi:hypothetical protein PIIN_07228 [Serendipita indica DSM 11827]|uniref:Uncharacterized protein n=1 Tax=Serendipita indica (strain DSM 11827) TaxID=1109443 RepID=G4TPM7_SERID|nr:hypothetical protein PIIN_07228 [Serendipita indica DSM 11827]